MKAIQRVKQYINKQGFNNSSFEKKNNLSNGYIGTQIKRNADLGEGVLNKILDNCLDLNPEWLLTGKGEMLKTSESTSNKNLIPLYEDVETFGGNTVVADTSTPVFTPSLQIDAGDWFNGATAAIRHYGDSMIEYQSGCILAIRQLTNKNEIIWGRNYVVETAERRITKQVAELDSENIICYSTNTDTHPDGRLKHQPITIRKEDIRHISRVLGSVNKEESTGKVKLL